MDKKTKDCALCASLFLVAAYALCEGFRLVTLAQKPPFRIAAFRVNPGMLPVILGGLLLFFTGVLLFNTLRHEPRPLAAFFDSLKTSCRSMAAALGNPDFISMLVSVTLMFIYCFGVLGRAPFWFGAIAFLLVLMTYLKTSDQMFRFFRATNFGVIVFTSVASVTAIILLFVTIFRTSLP
ncbi:MAG: tripartite tricarboxylate transporter TctB family protein [Planctomycetes bacterium]|nr:tripartite tricarboxylate transporter TctB family protein [Planctomycetota bacterium]